MRFICGSTGDRDTVNYGKAVVPRIRAFNYLLVPSASLSTRPAFSRDAARGTPWGRQRGEGMIGGGGAGEPVRSIYIARK